MHPSNSKPQQEIEVLVLDKIGLTSKKIKIDGIEFNFDGFSDEKREIVEIVNGIVQNIEIINNTERAKKEGWRTLADYIEEDIEDDSEDAW